MFEGSRRQKLYVEQGSTGSIEYLIYEKSTGAKPYPDFLLSTLCTCSVSSSLGDFEPSLRIIAFAAP